ncbi:MAG TPA: chorismate synthase, partial [Methanothrix sp.]|nr:chorismate synthase [Methanothrix sp.]
IVCRIAVKPTPSIAKRQRTVDLLSGDQSEIEIQGRHDPSIPPRIVPVAEAMVALVLADHLLRNKAARVEAR